MNKRLGRQALRYNSLSKISYLCSITMNLYTFKNIFKCFIFTIKYLKFCYSFSHFIASFFFFFNVYLFIFWPCQTAYGILVLQPGIKPVLHTLEEKEMATHSSTLAWTIPWTEEPGRLQSMGSLRVGHD